MPAVTRNPKITVVGGYYSVLVLNCPRLPRQGETLTHCRLSRQTGGKGASQAIAAARAGAAVSFVGAHGDDETGAAARNDLEQEGIDATHFTRRRNLSSGSMMVLEDGPQSALLARSDGANQALTAADVLKASAAFSQARAVLCQLEIPLAAVQAAAGLARRRDVPFILNASPAAPLPPSLVKAARTLSLNEKEALHLTGQSSPQRAAARFLALGCDSVVITLSERGVLLADHAGQRTLPAPVVKLIDALGAGDCFDGWLAAGMAEGWSLDESAAWAVHASSFYVARSGIRDRWPTRAQIQARAESGHWQEAEMPRILTQAGPGGPTARRIRQARQF